MKIRTLYALVAALLLTACTNTKNPDSAPAVAAAPTSKPAYPQAKTGETIDEYHGAKVSDPYRWLEDADSAETKAFIDEQNKLVREFVDGPMRDKFAARLTELLNYPRYSAPRKEGQYYFYNKNDGLQNQSVYYVSRSPADDKGARVLLDPNGWSKDGTIAMSGTTYSHDGELLAYGVSSGGSDQKDIRVLRVADGQRLPDELKRMKFANVAWKHDKSGFWYNRYPTPGSVPKEEEAKNNKLYWHTLGTSQGDDKLLFTPADKELSASPGVTDDGEYLLLYLNRGSTPKNRLYYRKANDPAAIADGDFVKLIDTEDADYTFIEHDGSTFYIQTNLDAPRRKIVAVDIKNPDRKNWKTIIPESSDAIQSVNCINNQFVIEYLHDAYSVIKIYNMDGKYVRDIELPGLGSVGRLSGKRTDRETFLTFTSFVVPATIYRYDFASNRLELLRKPEVKFDPSKYETKQVFARSKDGTRVPMFITHRKGISLDRNNAVILNAYGGFNVSETPSFSTSRIVWLENGGVYAQACLRGGGEYGEEWHKAGMLANKQNVFDDFYACAKWLIDNDYTSTKRLAIEGGSNGGLLVAACEVQWPEAFGAILCHVPLTDMLRYQHFTVGRFWVPEYGNAEKDAMQFNFLRAYSPLHNIKPGTKYPPTWVTTGEGDDRVAPLHARKFVAALQSADAGGNPILLRTQTRAGHGGGKPTSKQIEEAADQYAFLVKVFGLDWK